MGSQARGLLMNSRPPFITLLIEQRIVKFRKILDLADVVTLIRPTSSDSKVIMRQAAQLEHSLEAECGVLVATYYKTIPN